MPPCKRQPRQSVSKRSHEPRNRPRIVFSEHLERRDEIVEPDEIPAGSKRIGEEITELLEYKPGELYIRRLIRPEYALPGGEGVVIGELPSQPLPRTNAGPSLLAQLLVGKYQDHLPLHRQISILARSGVQLKASTVSDWVQGAAELLEPLYECLRKRVLECDYIQVDESIIPVLDKDKPGAARKGYHWVVRSPELSSLFFHYDKGSRAQYVVVELLKDFQGAVQSDGYGAYDIYENKQGVLLLGCWAHVRRKFEHALAEDPERAEYALRVSASSMPSSGGSKKRGYRPMKSKPCAARKPIRSSGSSSGGWNDRRGIPHRSRPWARPYAMPMRSIRVWHAMSWTADTVSTTTERRMPCGRWHWGARTIFSAATTRRHTIRPSFTPYWEHADCGVSIP